MSFEILDSSPKALEPEKPPKSKVEMPFDALTVGKSFRVPFSADIGEQSLRNRASREGKERGQKFRVIKHADSECYEVARVE